MYYLILSIIVNIASQIIMIATNMNIKADNISIPSKALLHISVAITNANNNPANKLSLSIAVINL